jgi:very-short-patch-repair endonuclease
MAAGVGMNAPEPATRSVADLIRQKLEQARTQLIERNLRNKLVNCALTSKRAQQVRVVDELPDEVFKKLLAEKRDMTFAPGRGLVAETPDENDPDYGVWTPPEAEKPGEDGVAQRHRDTVLQTQLTPEGLQKRLTSLYYESMEAEEEQGINVLYLALGFVKWFEDARSEVERYAPLILVPVELARKGARERFQLKARDEDLFTNVSLKIWLAEQHSIELPDLPEGDEWLPADYFAAVRNAIKTASRWQVLDSEILLGFFSFNKFLLWRDLDPANWPDEKHLLDHGILRTLLTPHEESGQSEPPLIPEQDRIDDHFKAGAQVTVLDTDSSQAVAIQTALAGRNLVIQGPPGTGKSQTIANVIAAAIHRGKSVLFVAEKLAALQVVHDRLRDVKLAPLCFELHSRRSSKQQVLGQLREAINAAAPPAPPQSLCSDLDKVTADLWAHSHRIHAPHNPSGFTAFGLIGAICRLRDQGVALPDFRVEGSENWTATQVDEFLKTARSGADRLQLAGVPTRHPWRGCERDTLNPLDAQRLSDHANKLGSSVDALCLLIRNLWPLVQPHESADSNTLAFSHVAKIAEALRLAATKPAESLDVLCNPRWNVDLDELDRLAKAASELADLELRLQPIFVDTAWASDWSSQRAEIAGSGRSMFRILRGSYRNALRVFRGACRTTLPKTYEERIAALDQLIAAQRLRSVVRGFHEKFSKDLGEIWTKLPQEWSRLATLGRWLRSANTLAPALSVRNRRLLGWSDEPEKWSERLTAVSTAVAENFKTLATFARLSETTLSGELIGCTIADLVERARAWKLSPHRYNEWPPVREYFRWLLSQAGQHFHQQVYTGDVAPADLTGRLHLAVCEQIWNQMCKTEPELARMDGRLLREAVEQFRTLDMARIRAASSEVARRHFDEKPTGSAGEMAIIRAELNKMRKLHPVRKLLDLAGNAVQALKPVFMMSPLSVAQYLAPGKLKFDLLLIDEASQVRPEDALGAIARAGQIVVVGDAKQLPPTNFFNRMVSDGDDAGDDDADDGMPHLGAMESVLSLCDATFANRAMLRWHYRSHHPALIAVSNFSFYDNKLLLPPSVGTGQSANGKGLVFHKTPAGGYDRGHSASNITEADIVADAACQFARNHPGKTLGIGTFSAAQRDVIRERIEARRREQPELETFFSAQRTNPFFVKNLESIQGDERDVIFISVGYGRDKDGRLPPGFGPINRDGGERRLNVLISRAKERCEVFSSLTAEEIDISSRKAGVVALRRFLQFAEKGYLDVPQTEGRTFDSDFEESVANFLRQRGFVVHPQVGMAGFYIDLGVLSSANSSQYLLGIECDGATYHSSRSARDRDRIRQQILESRGWRIHRIWSTDWFNLRQTEENRLLDALEHARVPPPIKAVERPPVDTGRSVEAPQPSDIKDTTRSATAYVEAAFRVTVIEAPHDAPRRVVMSAVSRIVDIEGPVHEEEIARRLATVWGLERAGNRIQDAAQRALITLEQEGDLKSAGPFWIKKGLTTVPIRDRSETASASLRKAEYLPPIEVSAAAAEIVRQSVRVPLDELICEVARRLGFRRTGQDLQAVIRDALESQVGKTLRFHEDGSVMIHQMN